jgi:hypothetical protein
MPEPRVETLVNAVPDYQILESRYDDFLFAEVGEQGNGMPISMASALTRLGLDPWDEAGRLASLPAKAAIAAVTTLIGRVPDLPIPALKIPDLAAGLVPLLARGAPARAKPAPAGMLAWLQILFRVDPRWLTVAIIVGALVAVSRLILSG